MASQEEIDSQMAMLNVYRRNLALYLRQLASLGPNQVTTAQHNGIRECRNNIQHIKNNLRAWNVQADDHPDDFESEPVAHSREVQVNMGADKVMLVIPISEFGRMLQKNSELLQFVVYKS